MRKPQLARTKGTTLSPASAEQPARASLAELARYFLWLGCTAFGGPAAHIAMMEDDVVTRGRWLTRDHFMDMLAATQLVPGPNSTEMAIHIGYVQQGLRGLLVAGACFILPAFVIVSALSVAYVAYGSLPAVGALFYGIQPVIVAIVLQAVYRLGRTALKTNALRMLALAALAGTLMAPFDPVWVIIGGGVVGLALTRLPRTSSLAVLWLPIPTAIAQLGDNVQTWLPSAWLAQVPTDPALWRLAWFFLKVGATLLGSGYLLISYLQNDLVNRFGWLTPQQLVDAIAVGQMTPGPVFTTAAFVGYVVRAGASGNIANGLLGAAVCALAIFLPSFIIVALMGPLMPWLRRSAATRAFLDGVNAAVVGTIAATLWSLLATAILNRRDAVWGWPLGGTVLDLFAAGLALGAAVVLVRERAPNSTLLIGAGALLGLLGQALAGNL